MKVVHIGFPKTATTFLQTRVFPRLPDSFRYLGRDRCAAFFRPVTDYDDTIFDVDRAARWLSSALQGAPDALVSYEPLTGAHYRSAFVNRTLIAHRLRLLGFDRVIISIRNQPEALESAYKEYIRHGGVLKFADYFWFDESRTPYFYPQYFAYSSIYRLYAEIFGTDNVLILQCEKLRTLEFQQDLCRFLKIPRFSVDASTVVNRSLSRRKTAILRWLNHLTYNDFQPSHPLSRKISTAFFCRCLASLPVLNDADTLVDPKTRGMITDYYIATNTELQDQARIVLAPEYPGSLATRRRDHASEPRSHAAGRGVS